MQITIRLKQILLSSWFSVFEISEVVDHIAEADVVKIVLVSQHDVELFLYGQKLPHTNQASEV